MGTDALLRVRDGKPKTDAAQRVPYQITFIRPNELFHSFRPEREPGRDLSASVETTNRCLESGSLFLAHRGAVGVGVSPGNLARVA